jgi:hypothetical protein
MEAMHAFKPFPENTAVSIVMLTNVEWYNTRVDEGGHLPSDSRLTITHPKSETVRRLF